MVKKAQAAMEFLMTYGFAILAVLVSIGALAYFGGLNPGKFLPEKCTITTGSGLFCKEFTSDSVTNKITIRIHNILSQSVWIDSVSLDNPSCTYVTADTEITADGTEDFELTGCTLTSQQKIKSTITISYSIGDTAIQGLSKSTTGQLATIAP